MSRADDLVGAVFALIGTDRTDVWHEVREMPFTTASCDVWFEGANRVSIAVSVTDGVAGVRVLCDEFEFASVPWASAPGFVAAVLTDDVRLTMTGRHRLAMSVTVAPGATFTAEASTRGRDLSDWERGLLAEPGPETDRNRSGC